MRQLLWLPAFLNYLIYLLWGQKISIGFLFLHGLSLKNIFLVYTSFLGLAPSYLCKLIMRPLSAISDRPLRSLDRNALLVPRSRTSTSQQCSFASAGPLLWNCLPAKVRAQILSDSLSSIPRFLKSFLFPGVCRTRGRLWLVITARGAVPKYVNRIEE